MTVGGFKFWFTAKEVNMVLYKFLYSATFYSLRKVMQTS